MMAP